MFYTYILEQPSVVSTATNESILAPLLKQTESFHSLLEIGCPTTFQGDGLAWLCLAWFAQILLQIKVPTQTLLNHIETHHGYSNIRHSVIARQANIHTLFTFHTRHKHSTTAKRTYIHSLFNFHTAELKEACWA